MQHGELCTDRCPRIIVMILRRVQQQHELKIQAFREWLEEFTENLQDEGVLASRETPGNTSQDSDRNVLQNWYRGSTVCLLTSRKTEKTLVTLITADHKVLNEGGESRNNHQYRVRRRKGVHESFSSRRKSQKSFKLTTL